MIEITNNELIEMYIAGFNDELDNSFMQGMSFNSNKEELAYMLGGAHAIIGDDMKNIDLLKRKSILKIINLCSNK